MKKFPVYLVRTAEAAATRCMRMASILVDEVLSVLSDRRATALVAALFCGCICAFAQDYNAGITAVEGVTSNIEQYVPVVRKLIYAVAAIWALVGAITVYIAMNNDDQDVKKKIMLNAGACLFLIAAATALPLFFGVSSNAGTELMYFSTPVTTIHDMVATSLAA